ncbi:hypothetical protein K7A41_06395 [Sphingobacterium sp. InxBP1]|uniref:hypothetical protein n=1 Tax=Sphingobacterium sp. InxBP1 TaxID=2870328 RepID=UPI0022430B76|nr:hypothetical protein [Sphingobacterium sp. InxBP1]MCW8310846.1 hypothetical protein [Sphingobacterium sp. InxBP1]
MSDYKKFNLKSFIDFIEVILEKKFRGKFNYSEIKSQIENTLDNETSKLTALSFYKVLKIINEDIDKTCIAFFKGHTAYKLESLNHNANKLSNLFTPLLNSRKDLSKASSIKETRLGEIFEKRFDQLYAYEAYGLSVAAGLKPSQLFEYFYGDGERPMIGMVPSE